MLNVHRRLSSCQSKRVLLRVTTDQDEERVRPIVSAMCAERLGLLAGLACWRARPTCAIRQRFLVCLAPAPSWTWI
jgi:hypothetical protein